MNTYIIKSFSLRILHEEIKKIISGSENVIRLNLDEIKINDLISEANYFSLLNEHKYIIANNFKFKKENEILLEYIKKPNENTTLILIADTLDKRTTLYKELSKLTKMIIIDEIDNLNKKIYEYAKSNNIEIDYGAVSLLLEYNLNNYDLSLNEIDKIGSLHNTITKDLVEKYSNKLITEENFEFSDAVLSKNYKKIKEYLDEFILLKLEPSQFIALLASQYRIMYASLSINDTNDEIAKILNIHPYRVKLAKEKSKYYTKEEIHKILLDLCDLDYNLKTSNIDKYQLLKIFLINI